MGVNCYSPEPHRRICPKASLFRGIGDRGIDESFVACFPDATQLWSDDNAVI